MITAIVPRFFQPFQCDELIRLGKNNDGGYLVNAQDILGSNHLLSYGVGKDWSFEKHFSGIIDCSIDAYDQSLDDELLADNQALQSSYHEFFVGNKKHIKKNVGPRESDVSFLSTLTNNHTFLKCDIEGGEYDILDYIIEMNHIFTGMVIEFHDVERQDRFFDIVNFMCKIGHKLVHIHANNWAYLKTNNGCIPSVIEMTFSASPNVSLNKKLMMPHKLDMPNNPMGEEIQINFN
jgi:hypothetical protein